MLSWRSGADIEQEPQWKKDYYNEVILPDERRFLVSDALLHFKILPAGSVDGEKRVVIQGGKAMIDVPVCLVFNMRVGKGVGEGKDLEEIKR
jgi:hypothetical protein